MIYPRVNFLQKAEQRYQGVVSHRFIILCGIASVISIVVLLGGIQQVRYSSISSELKVSRAAWEMMAPRYESLLNQDRGLKANRKLLILFDGWDASKASFGSLLRGLQEAIPENTQITRFSVRGDQVSSSYATPEEMVGSYKLAIEGVSKGERAESDVIRLRKDLIENEKISSTFSAIKLAALRKRSGSDGKNMREFKFEGRSADGGEE